MAVLGGVPTSNIGETGCGVRPPIPLCHPGGDGGEESGGGAFLEEERRPEPGAPQPQARPPGGRLEPPTGMPVGVAPSPGATARSSNREEGHQGGPA